MSVSIDLAGVECNLVAPVRRGDYQRASGDSGYHRYAWVLKWLTVSLLAYPITAFLVPRPRDTTLRVAFVPRRRRRRLAIGKLIV